MCNPDRSITTLSRYGSRNRSTSINEVAASSPDDTPRKDGIFSLRCVLLLLFVDVFVTTLLTCSPILLRHWSDRHQHHQHDRYHFKNDVDIDDDSDFSDDDDQYHYYNNYFTFSHHYRYTFSESLLDLLVLSLWRCVFALIALMVSFYRADIRKEYNNIDLYHPNGNKKTRDELEEEALQQSFKSWFCTYVHRSAFMLEVVCFVTTCVCVLKCLVRLNIELGVLNNSEKLHPILWSAFLFATIISTIEITYVDACCVLLGKWGDYHYRYQQQNNNNNDNNNNNSGSSSNSNYNNNNNNLQVPLLADNDDDDDEGRSAEEGSSNITSSSSCNDDEEEEEHNRRGFSEIGGDTEYRASWYDLLKICAPDAFLIALASVFLVAAATMQIYIPKYTGAILDALEEAYSSSNNSTIIISNNNEEGFDDGVDDDDGGIQNVPGFMTNVRKLIIVSILGGIFSGFRGSIFMVVGGRVNVRLRLRLMSSILTFEQGFFDVTKTGDITSRLSSDTTLVGDQVTLNVNVFLRSLVQVIGVLIFMFMISWQLSLLAFISVPVITVLSRWYGNFVRSLTKVMQTKLAEGNSVSEAAISSMSTIKSFDAGSTEYKEFKKYMDDYLELNLKSAIAYSGYATVSTSLPQLVTALVVFYGGLLCRSGKMTSGELVSFLLYLQSLSDAFSSIGYIFSSLTQAVGAADKIFELMHRKPRETLQQQQQQQQQQSSSFSSFGCEFSLVEKKRTTGLEPNVCRGEIALQNVEMYYPARPNKRVLNDMSLSVPPGSIVALCGTSGGGKSSIISLVQHLYEQSSGKVILDDNEVHEYSPRWLSQHISIVQQEPILFARSIKRNIIYGLEGTSMEPSEEEIERIAKLSNCHDFISKMPMQYETEVGERGVQLSGGQKQRIAIARALIRKPKILLLDEATSALDAESEHMVQQAINHMIDTARASSDGAGMSVMIVAHRLSTIRNADTIYVVQDGKVIEKGNHSELIQNTDGAYSALVRRQMNVQNSLENKNEINGIIE